jgi:hypothetical protein
LLPVSEADNGTHVDATVAPRTKTRNSAKLQHRTCLETVDFYMKPVWKARKNPPKDPHTPSLGFFPWKKTSSTLRKQTGKTTKQC